ncbi:MAG: hypothetical protein KIT27_08490 [Legionellales bacterium]|nr:hypothetical protein [Legionellales bacterium]
MKTRWEKQASTLLKIELTRRDFTYEDLRLALLQLGVEKTTSNLTKTINEGKFPFAFFLLCAEALGIEDLRLK